jgi:hypothetical protein
VISGLEINPIRALIGVLALYGNGIPLAQCNNKRGGGHSGAREPTFTVPTVPPQTLATKTDQEGVEARGLVHLTTNRRPPTVTDTMSSSSSVQDISM